MKYSFKPSFTHSPCSFCLLPIQITQVCIQTVPFPKWRLFWGTTMETLCFLQSHSWYFLFHVCQLLTSVFGSTQSTFSVKCPIWVIRKQATTISVINHVSIVFRASEYFFFLFFITLHHYLRLSFISLSLSLCLSRTALSCYSPWTAPCPITALGKQPCSHTHTHTH